MATTTLPPGLTNISRSPNLLSISETDHRLRLKLRIGIGMQINKFKAGRAGLEVQMCTGGSCYSSYFLDMLPEPLGRL